MDISNTYEVSQSRDYMSPMQNIPNGIVQNWPQQLPSFPDHPLVMAPNQQTQVQKHLTPNNQVMVDSQIQQEMMSPNWPVRPLLPMNVPNNKQMDMQSVDFNKPNGEMQRMPLAVDANGKFAAKTATDTDDSTDDKDTEYDDKVKPTEPPRKKSRKHKKLEMRDQSKKSNDDGVQGEMKSQIQSDLSLEFLDHDGEAERPGGAVLSLTLGKSCHDV